MKLLNLILPSYLVTAQTLPPPLSAWELTNWNLECGFSSNTVLSFEIYPGDVDFDTSDFVTGSCTQNDIIFTRTAVDNSTLPAEQQALGRSRFTVSYNPQTCTGVAADPTDISSYASTVTFDFDMGYVISGIRMNMRTYRIPAICEFASQYDLRFDFGMLERPVVTVSPDSDSVEQPVYGGPGFAIKVFKQSDLTEEVFQTETNMKGGEMAYFTIEADRALPSDLRFAPPTCRFVNEACDAENRCNELMGFDLFHYQQNECDQPAGSPLNFDLSYINGDMNKWRSQFRLFLFNQDVDESTYVLRCSVDICVAACSDSDVVGTQQCNAIADVCLTDENYPDFIGSCAASANSASSGAVTNPLEGTATAPDEQYLTLTNDNGDGLYARTVTIDGDDAIYTTGHRWGGAAFDFPIADHYKIVRRNMNDGTLVYDRGLAPGLFPRQDIVFSFPANGLHKASLRFGNFLLIGGTRNNLDVYDVRNGDHVWRFERGISGNALDDTTNVGISDGFGRDFSYVPTAYADWRVYDIDAHVNAITDDGTNIYVRIKKSAMIIKFSISDEGALTEITNTSGGNLTYPWTNGPVNSCAGGSYYAMEINRGNSYTGIDVYNSNDMTHLINIPYSSALYENYGGGLIGFENSYVFSDMPVADRPDNSNCIRSDLSTMHIWQERYLVLIFIQDCENGSDIDSRGLMMILDLDNEAKVLRWDVIMDAHGKFRSVSFLDGNFLIMNGCDLTNDNMGDNLETSGWCTKRTIVSYDVSKFFNGDDDYLISSIQSDDYGWNTVEFKFFAYANGHIIFGNKQNRGHVGHIEYNL